MLGWMALWVDLGAWACVKEVDICQLHAVESFQNLPGQLGLGEEVLTPGVHVLSTPGEEVVSGWRSRPEVF